MLLYHWSMLYLPPFTSCCMQYACYYNRTYYNLTVLIIQLRELYIKDYFFSFPMLRIKFWNVF